MSSARLVSSTIPMKLIAGWDGMSQGIGRVLGTAFEAEDYLDCVEDFWPQDINPPSYINNLDKVSSYPVRRQHL